MAELLTDALRWWTRARPEATALVCGDEDVSYRELGAWTDRVAAHLVVAHDIGPGDVVAIAGTNSMDWCVAALAALKAGAVITPFNYRYTAHELGQLVDSAAPKLVFTDDAQATKLATIEGAQRRFALLPLATVRDVPDTAVFDPPTGVVPADPAVIAFTSGTTGAPKGLIYTHHSILTALFELLLKDPTPPEDTNHLLALPLFTVAGIKHALLHSVARGGKVVVMRDFDPAEGLDLLVRHRVSHLNGVPVIFERMAAQPAFESLDLSHIKVAMVGGARVSDELQYAWHRRGVALRHMYGMTEAGGCGSVPRPDDALAHPELCGDGSIFTEVRTARLDGTVCDPGEEGEILLRGPAMMAGYWRNPAATKELMPDGWIHSGDIGVIDEDGYLRFVDRSKDLIISGGFNVSPSEVEAVIAGLPGVIEVAVVAVPDKQWGEVPLAVLYGDGLDPDAVIAAVREQLAVFKVPKYVVVSPEPLPRMSSGKIAKRELKERYGSLAAIV
jgi:fatty-acyl-CoA synthase